MSTALLLTRARPRDTVQKAAKARLREPSTTALPPPLLGGPRAGRPAGDASSLSSVFPAAAPHEAALKAGADASPRNRRPRCRQLCVARGSSQATDHATAGSRVSHGRSNVSPRGRQPGGLTGSRSPGLIVPSDELHVPWKNSGTATGVSLTSPQTLWAFRSSRSFSVPQLQPKLPLVLSDGKAGAP